MRLPDKHRYLNAARRIETEEICFQEDEIEVSVAAKLLGRPLPMVRPFELPVDDYVEVNRRAGNDMLYLSHIWELGRKNFIDAEGRKHYIDGTIKTRTDLATITTPDLGEIERHLDAVLTALAGTGMGLVYTASQAPFIVTTAMGYQDYYICLCDDPAFVHEFQAIVEEFCLRELELALRYPVDAVQVGAVICSKTGPMLCREMIEEFEFPSLRQRIGIIREHGRVVSLHTDGNITAFVPDFIDMGVDVINPIEPCDGAQDIYALKAQYGDRIALHGNIDLAGVLVYGTPEAVARDVTEHIARLAPGGGYIVASSHNITEAVPLENFLAMRDAVHQYRRSSVNARR